MKLTFILFTFLLLFNSCVKEDSYAQNISPEKFNQVITHEKFNGVILDVRTPFEWKESGIIKNAVTLNAYDPKFVKKITKLDKSKIYYIYCHSGVRSSKVLDLMIEKGFIAVNMLKGIVGWKAYHYPLEKYESF